MDDDRTVWVGNFEPERVTQELLYELFLQAGPLAYVRIPKDKATGKLKNFAFICYRHIESVPYAIELLNGTPLFSRSIRVQSRYLQDLQQRGLASSESGGIHTLDPFSPKITTGGDLQVCDQQYYQQCYQQYYQQYQQHYQQQYEQQYQQQYQQQQQQQQQLWQYQQPTLSPMPSLMRGQGAHIPSHILAMAQQQIAMLNIQQPVLLSENPMLNSPRHRTTDRFGSLNHGRNYSNQRDDSLHGQSRQHDSRTGGPRSVDNETMRAMKSRFDRDADDNSKMLSQLHQRQGRFDYSRLGPRNDHSSRQHDERSQSHERSHRHNDRYDNSSRHQRQSDDHGRSSGRSRHDPYSRSSRR